MFTNLFGDGRIGGFLAVVIGLCLLGLIVSYAWRAFGRGIRPAASRGGRQARLGIVDAFDLDRHRQLVLVRRDNVEHLIMIGGPNDVLIEGEIVRSQPSGAERREPSAPQPAPVQGERQPPRMTIEPGTGQGAAQAPTLDVKPGAPETQAPAAPGRPTVSAPQLRPTLEPAAGESVAPPAPLARPPSVTGAGPRPMPPRPAPPLRPSPGPAPAQPPAPAPQQAPQPPMTSTQPPRPGAPTLAQRPMTAPAVTPPAPPTPDAERAAETAKDKAPEAPKLAVDIDSLEEEMAKLLGRPVEPKT